ncbi:N-6 DNA methylase, partial [Acidimicrobiaceae bacterium]|nr:N-6 DNA methylase [Acidimicrobiaceae bacterium]
MGALLPSDVLTKIVDSEGLEGLAPEAYGHGDVRLRDVVSGAWNELKPLWWGLQRELKALPESDVAATALTREKWLLPLLGALGFDGLETQHRAIDVGGTAYPISHVYNHSPIHLMGARAGLDTRIAGIPGAAKLSPHSLVQQFLNRSDDHLWGVVTNGNKLRLLRDSVSLTRQAFVEFDLAAMFNGEVYTDFNLLYRTIHATRFNGERPEHALLESWVKAAREDGTRARDQLRNGVQTAIETLGTGFLTHPNNEDLRASIANGDTTEADLYKHLLRLIYRLLFLFVAEDRDLLHPEGTTPETRDRYTRFYSATRLRDLSTKPTATQHDDLWHSLKALMDVLAKDEGEPKLGLPGLGSFLWQHNTIGQLRNTSLTNHHLLTAIGHLSHTQQDQTNRRIDYTQLGAEELGSIYESLLELHPKIDTELRVLTLDGGAGSERKTTGSYYTPTELISELLNTALDPVLDRASQAENPEAALLDLKIVDPACGSGHFLLAAANRVAKRVAEIRTGEPEPPTEDHRSALRDVISRCIFAVDLNELAVELCKVSLWIETLEPGKPLSFLDHHILVGNSLFGATPDAIDAGIPSEAFKPMTGDDPSVVKLLAARHKKELKSKQTALAFGSTAGGDLAAEIEALEDFDDLNLQSVRVKESLLAELRASSIYQQHRLLADAWCAAFAIEKSADSPGLTAAVFDAIRGGSIDPELRRTIEELADKYRFFHWHVEFPQIFNTAPGGGRTGGFDVVLGNPPWERAKLQEKEFFASNAPEIAQAANKAQRQRMIDRLPEENPELWHRFQAEVRTAETVSHQLRNSGLFPLCGRGDVNTYTVFAELMRSLVASDGRVGVIVPSGIATDDTTKHFFADLIEKRSLHSLYDFENRNGIFAGVHRSFKFCLLTMTGLSTPVDEAEFVFFALDTADLADADRRFTLTPEDFALLNPNTRTCPVFRTRRDAEITKAIYR